MTRRLLAECFNPRGLPKKKFPDEKAAVEFRASRREAKGLRPYRCTACGFFHLGHRRRA